MEYLEYLRCIDSVRCLKGMLEEEAKNESEKPAMYSFERKGSSPSYNVIDFDFELYFTNDSKEYTDKYKLSKPYFLKHLEKVINKYKNDIMRDVIASMQEEARQDKERLFANFCKMIEDINDITKQQ